MIILEDLEKKYSFDKNKNLINFTGREADIFLIEKFAAKIKKYYLFPRTETHTIMETISEYNLAKHFFINDISVPKPIGVYAVEDEEKKLWAAFMMEYLSEDYKCLDFIFGVSHKRAIALREIELKKVRELGYNSVDSKFYRNAMYSEEKDDLKIFDFSRYYKI